MLGAGVIAALVVTQTLGSACAAPGMHAASRSGKATFYTLSTGTGNCSFPSDGADGLYVALSPGEYGDAAACGSYLSVSGPRGTVRVKVVDQCPECEAGHIDLSRTAFARIGDPAKGVLPVTYRRLVDPPLPGPLKVRVKEGSSRYWLALLVDNTGNPLSRIEVRSGSGSWQVLSRADYNYWIAESGAGAGPFRVRITDTRGHRLTVTGIRLAPGTIQSTSSRMYSAGGGSTSRLSTSTTRITRTSTTTGTLLSTTSVTTPGTTSTSWQTDQPSSSSPTEPAVVSDDC
ncbi:MAG: hypothetical protein GXX79_15065 [Actinomycetales bacterium]|nr:hypothetical protein [Actinomycetales bacterium]